MAQSFARASWRLASASIFRKANFVVLLPPMKVLETNRLNLRRICLDDAEFMLQLLNEPSFLQFIGDKGVRTIDDARNYISQGPMASYDQFGFGLYLTELKEPRTPIGMCGLLKRDTLEDVD